MACKVMIEVRTKFNRSELSTLVLRRIGSPIDGVASHTKACGSLLMQLHVFVVFKKRSNSTRRRLIGVFLRNLFDPMDRHTWY